jgi:hypothetical protein
MTAVNRDGAHGPPYDLGIILVNRWEGREVTPPFPAGRWFRRGNEISYKNRPQVVIPGPSAFSFLLVLVLEV